MNFWKIFKIKILVLKFGCCSGWHDDGAGGRGTARQPLDRGRHQEPRACRTLFNQAVRRKTGTCIFQMIPSV